MPAAGRGDVVDDGAEATFVHADGHVHDEFEEGGAVLQGGGFEGGFCCEAGGGGEGGGGGVGAEDVVAGVEG